MTFDAARVRSWYDAYEDREWRRLEETLLGRIRYAIHHHILADAIEPGARAIDVGSGPGRFAIDMLEAGADVTLVDLSPEMLRQAREHLAAAGVEAEAFVEGDIRDLNAFDDASFDLVLAYGGVVSYAYSDHARAIAELARIAKPGAPILVSAMTLVGTMRLIGSLDADAFAAEWRQHLPELDWDTAGVALTVPGSNEWHLPLALYTSQGLAADFAAAGCDVERYAVANPLTMLGQPLEAVSASPEASQWLIDLEVALCERPGLRDSGEHLIALARKRS